MASPGIDPAAAARPGARPAARTVTRHALSLPLPEDLENLLALSACANLESSGHWYANLHCSLYAADPGMAMWALRDGPRVLAALPLRVEAKRPVRTVWPLSHDFYTALFTPAMAPQATPQDLAELLRGILKALGPVHGLRFSPMDAEAPTFRLMESALREAGLPSFRFFCFDNWSLQAPATWAEYLAGRSANQRSAIRRGARKLLERGGRMEIITNPADVARGMAAYWQVYAASWKQDEPWPVFIDGLAHRCAEQGELRLGLAWLDGRPIAAQLWMVGHGRAEIVKLAYDEMYKELAPGNALTAALLRHAIERDEVRQVDYLIGGDTYKRTWMSHQVERWGLMAYNPRTLLGLLGWLRQMLAERTRRWRRPASAPRVPDASADATSAQDAP